MAAGRDAGVGGLVVNDLMLIFFSVGRGLLKKDGLVGWVFRDLVSGTNFVLWVEVADVCVEVLVVDGTVVVWLTSSSG